MSTLGQTLNLAVQYYQTGNWYQAEQLCQQMLQIEPYHVDVLHLLGLVAVHSGRHAQACDYIRQALRLKPDHAEAHNNLGSVLLEMGRLDEAETAYRQAIRYKPRYAEAYSNLGNVLRQQGKFDEAMATLKQAVQVNPDSAGAHNNLGLALQSQGKLDEAVTRYRIAVRLKPDLATAQSNLGNALREQGKLDEARACLEEALRLQPNFAEAHSHLGNVLRDQGQLPQAVAQYQEALRLRPEFAEALSNLGVAYRDQGKQQEAEANFVRALQLQPNFAPARFNLGALLLEKGETDEAIQQLQEALRLAPNFPDAHSELGNAYLGQGRLDQSLSSLDKALKLQPRHPEALNNRAIVLGKQGKWTEAIAAFREALKEWPNHAWMHYNLGTHLLLTGDLAAGWPEYEWRWKTREVPPRSFYQPLWDGAALEGKTILLHAEQGLGDTLHFVRYAPLVKERGGTVVVECQKSLLRLLARTPGVDRLAGAGEPLAPFDVHAPLLSLPAVFQTSQETIPGGVPYVFADPALEERWRAELGKLPGFKIGISWQGNPRHKRDRERSFALRELARVARLPGVTLISLQKGVGAEQLASLGSEMQVVDLGPNLDEEAGPFMDTAAIMKSLDLVLTSDTATAHLAGTLGVPVWVALAFSPDWRWMLEREDSPWYPSMRLFRQPRPGDWAAVFERIQNELKERVK
jgi:tetratricopeptide (TPR) repeat protein